jgi:YbbR domain-containing protein
MKKLHTLSLELLEKLNSFSWFRGISDFMNKHKIVQKFLCLVIAAVLWYYNDTKRLSEVHFKVPVQVDMSRDFAVADIERRQISVTVRGNAEDLRNVGQNNLSAYLRIQNPVPGDAARFPVTVLGNEMPESVQIEPADKTLYVTVERRVVKKVPIEPVLEGSVDSGYFVGNSTITPSETEVSGPESVMKKLHTLTIEPVSLTGYTTTFRIPAKINPESTKYLDLYQKNFVIEVPVFDGRNISRVKRDIVPVNMPENIAYSFSAKAAEVYLKNDKPDQAVSPDDLDLYIDGSDSPVLSRGDAISEEIVVYLPVRVRNRTGSPTLEIVPGKIAVKVRKK